MQFPFGPYRPDVAETNPAMSRRLLNVNIRKDSSGVSYHPRKSLQVTMDAGALPDSPRGGLAVVTRAGVFKGYWGTVDSLYSLDADLSFTQIGTGYALPTGNNWGLCQYGDWLIATNTIDGMLQWGIEAGGTVDPIADAPKARAVFQWAEMLVALDCDGDNRVLRYSAPGDYTNWKTRGAGAQEFADGEALMGGGVLNDGTATIIQRAGVSFLSLTGDQLVFRKDTVAPGVGAVSPQCIVQAPSAVFFLDSSGPYIITTQGVQDIGVNKVARSFIASVDDLSQIEGAYDPGQRQVVWRKSSTALLVYDLGTSEFVEVEENTAAIVKMSSAAVTLEDLDAFGTLDELPYSLDSAVWKGDRPRLGALNSEFKFGFFDGPNLAASIDTAALTNIRSMLARWATPITDSENVTLALGCRDRLADTEEWKDPEPMQASGRVPLRGRGKVLTLRAEYPAGDDWTYLRGIDDFDMSIGGPK